MQTTVDAPAIMEMVKKVGNTFLADFRKTVIPQNMDDFMTALKSIEDRCFEMLKNGIDPLYANIPWVDDNEFDGDAQRQPAPYAQYWLCDTMDGAIQYLQHIPGWTINLVLIGSGEPVLSIIYDPLTNELYHAEKNKGAYLNGNPIHPIEKKSVENMLTVLEYGHQLKLSPDWEEMISLSFTRMLDKFGVVRNYGPHALQLAYVAAGRIDLFVQHDLDTHNWLAGILIAREAGAAILSANATPWRWGDQSLLAGTQKTIAAYLNTK